MLPWRSPFGDKKLLTLLPLHGKTGQVVPSARQVCLPTVVNPQGFGEQYLDLDHQRSGAGLYLHLQHTRVGARGLTVQRGCA